MVVLGVLVAQWIRASEREARRIDRELDRAEEAEGGRDVAKRREQTQHRMAP